MKSLKLEQIEMKKFKGRDSKRSPLADVESKKRQETEGSAKDRKLDPFQ